MSRYIYTTTHRQAKAAADDPSPWRWQTPEPQRGPSGVVHADTAHAACRMAASEIGHTIPDYGDGVPVGSPREATASTREGLNIRAVLSGPEGKQIDTEPWDVLNVRGDDEC